MIEQYPKMYMYILCSQKIVKVISEFHTGFFFNEGGGGHDVSVIAMIKHCCLQGGSGGMPLQKNFVTFDLSDCTSDLFLTKN